MKLHFPPQEKLYIPPIPGKTAAAVDRCVYKSKKTFSARNDPAPASTAANKGNRPAADSILYMRLILAKNRQNRGRAGQVLTARKKPLQTRNYQRLKAFLLLVFFLFL